MTRKRRAETAALGNSNTTRAANTCFESPAMTFKRSTEVKGQCGSRECDIYGRKKFIAQIWRPEVSTGPCFYDVYTGCEVRVKSKRTKGGKRGQKLLDVIQVWPH